MLPRPRHPAPAPASGAAGASASAGGEAREVEWQLAAPDLEVVRQWLEQHAELDDLRIGPLPAQQLHDIYLDTEDWRILRAGFALRLRTKPGHLEATLKSLRSARDDAADRREISEPLSGDGLKALSHARGPVGSRVRDVAGVKPLRTLFEVRTSRQRFAVRARGPGRTVGEIALDEARFSRGNGHRRPMIMTRVELEAVGPDSAPVERVAGRLRAECGLQPAKENKFAVGLRSASLESPWRPDPARKAEPVQAAITASTRAGDFAAAALQRLLAEWHDHEPGARLGESPEALHALRVTARRMDTVLSLFRDHLPAAVGRSRQRLKDLLDAFGAVRDVDIRLEAVGQFRGDLPEGERPALDPLLRQLEAERSAARAAMLRALDAKPARHWLESLPGELARAAPRAGSARDAAALAVVPDLIRRRYRKLRKCARRLTPRSSLREYHKVRVRTKKLRYALELVAPTYAKSADEMLDELHGLQDKLGSQHDAGAIAGYLQQLALHPPASLTPETLFMMGRMAERHTREAARLGPKVGKRWRKVRGRCWKPLRAHMQERREEAPRSPAKLSHKPAGAAAGSDSSAASRA